MNVERCSPLGFRDGGNEVKFGKIVPELADSRKTPKFGPAPVLLLTNSNMPDCRMPVTELVVY